MKTIIAGSRDITDTNTLLLAIADSGWKSEITEVVCGKARGVDTLGEQWAKSHGIPVKEFPADWETHGKSAGPKRNRQMAEYAEALILVWDGKSRGSANMLQEAKKRGLKIHQHIVN
jgi:hypothetical protein